MRLYRFITLLSVLFALAFAGVSRALAHDGEPLKSISVRIGPYPVTVHYYTEPRGGQELLFAIEPEAGAIAPTDYRATAIPGTLVSAVPVKASLQPDPDHPNAVQGRVNIPVSGQWLLYVEVEGPFGSSFEDVPILAGAPPAIPEWLGWLIGLTPVWAILGVILWQARRPAPHPVTATGTH
jgi:hypothetical protein